MHPIQQDLNFQKKNSCIKDLKEKSANFFRVSKSDLIISQKYRKVIKSQKSCSNRNKRKKLQVELLEMDISHLIETHINEDDRGPTYFLSVKESSYLWHKMTKITKRGFLKNTRIDSNCRKAGPRRFDSLGALILRGDDFSLT